MKPYNNTSSEKQFKTLKNQNIAIIVLTAIAVIIGLIALLFQ